MSLPQPDVVSVQLCSGVICNTFSGSVGSFLDTRGYSVFDLFFQITGTGTALKLTWIASVDGTSGAGSTAPLPIYSDAGAGEFDLLKFLRITRATPGGPGLRTFWIPNLPAIGMGGKMFLETTGDLVVTVQAVRKVAPPGTGLAAFLVP